MLQTAILGLCQVLAHMTMLCVTRGGLLVAALSLSVWLSCLCPSEAQSGVLEFRSFEATPAKPEEPKTFTIRWDSITSDIAVRLLLYRLQARKSTTLLHRLA
jgi:hypothetical protein